MADRVALNLRWCFGFNKDSNDGTLIDLTGDGRQAIFYAVGHTGIIFDYEIRRQRLLQGHTNTIMCAAASDDKKWLVTGDAGEKDTMVVIWNSRTGVPVRTIFDAHPGGVLCVDMTHDAVYIATVGAGPNQALSIWEWTVNSDTPLHTEPITSKDLQHCVRFSRDDPKELVTNSPRRPIFWDWSEGKLKYYSPVISKKEFSTPVGRFTKSVFLPNSTQAVTGDAALPRRAKAACLHPEQRTMLILDSARTCFMLCMLPQERRMATCCSGTRSSCRHCTPGAPMQRRRGEDDGAEGEAGRGERRRSGAEGIRWRDEARRSGQGRRACSNVRGGCASASVAARSMARRTRAADTRRARPRAGE
jgi:WD40 repeat protein